MEASPESEPKTLIPVLKSKEFDVPVADETKNAEPGAAKSLASD